MQLPKYYGFCGEYVYWELNNNILTLCGYGETNNYDYYTENYAPWYELRNNISSIQFKGNIECLGNSIFYGLPSISKIQVPETVTTLKNNVFYKCEKLKDIVLPETLVSIGSGVLSKTLFEENEENWYENGFYYNNYLLKTKMNVFDDFVFKPNTKLVASSAFMHRSYKNIIIPDTIKSVGSHLFYDCSAESIIFKGTVDNINSICMFYNCDYLTTVILPKGMKEIDASTFESCDALEFIELPEGMDTIWNYGFKNCINLRSIIIPTTITTINDGTFYGCNALTDIYFKNSSVNTPYLNEVNNCFFNATFHFNTPYLNYEIQKNDSKYIISIDVHNITQGEILLAGYKNSRLVNIDSTSVQNNISLEMSGEFDKFKIMVWNNYNYIKPMCRAVEIFN